MFRYCIFDDFIPAFRSAIGEGPVSFSKKGTKLHRSDLSANSAPVATTYRQSTSSNFIGINKRYQSRISIELNELIHSFKDTHLDM